MITVLVSLGLVSLAILAALLAAAGAEDRCNLPEEPWIWWDGDDPEELQ